MEGMKTAEEIINRVIGISLDADKLVPMDTGECIACITEDRKQIKDMINEETTRLEQKLENTSRDEKELRWVLNGKIEALTELKDKLNKGE